MCGVFGKIYIELITKTIYPWSHLHMGGFVIANQAKQSYFVKQTKFWFGETGFIRMLFQNKLGQYLEIAVGHYHSLKKYLPITLFFGGFTWDSLTLTRIDRMIDNIILLIYFLLAGAFIVLIVLDEKHRIRHKFLLKYNDYYPLGLQFTLGALFSAYVVFYFKSAALTKNWLFFAILLILLVANEFLEDRLNNLYLVFSLYFLAAFSFFIFFIPVLIKVMNVWTFVSGSIFSLIFIMAFVVLLYRKLLVITKKQAYLISAPVCTLFVCLNVFYTLNWIPPVPLSLKTGEIYRSIAKVAGDYRVKHEKPRWYQLWKDSESTYKYTEGDTIFCFTSIFAPTLLKKQMYHHWQQYNTNREEWLTTDRIGYEITGGRDGGYRGFTYKRNAVPGKWRVDVETDGGLLLGRIGFKVVEADSPVQELETRLE